MSDVTNPAQALRAIRAEVEGRLAAEGLPRPNELSKFVSHRWGPLAVAMKTNVERIEANDVERQLAKGDWLVTLRHDEESVNVVLDHRGFVLGTRA